MENELINKLATKNMNNTLCKVDGMDFPVELIQTGIDKFCVIYGLHICANLNYADAAAEFGECVMHSAACSGKLITK